MAPGSGWETEGRGRSNRPPSLLAHPDRGDSLNAKGLNYCRNFSKWTWRNGEIVRRRYYCSCRACPNPGCGDALAARDLRRAEVRLTTPTIYARRFSPEEWTVKAKNALAAWKRRESKKGHVIQMATANLISATWVFATADPPGGWRAYRRPVALELLRRLATVDRGLESMRFTRIPSGTDDPKDIIRGDPLEFPGGDLASSGPHDEQHLGMCRLDIDGLAYRTLLEMADQECVDLSAADPDSRFKLVQRALAVAHELATR